MTDPKQEQSKPTPAQQDDVPAHATEEERERLKDKNKDGIPPGYC
ncbi:hypothetical protein [Pseudomonas sp.]|nr:hypothetical protein [Pseudomonas sp.]